MSNYLGYDKAFNQKRKAKNTYDNHFGSSTNTNSKSWTTLNATIQFYKEYRMRKMYKEKAKDTLKIYTKEEIENYKKIRGI